MNYLLLAAVLLTQTPEQVPPLQQEQPVPYANQVSLPPQEQQVPYVYQVLSWSRRINSFPAGNARVYSRIISIDRRIYTVTYEDRGKPWKSVEDILTIEGGSTMFIDEGADGTVESGEVEGIFFLKDQPPGQLKHAQEAYAAMLERIAKKGNREDRHDGQ